MEEKKEATPKAVPTKKPAVKKAVAKKITRKPAAKKAVTLKLPCSNTDCDAIPPGLADRPKVTMYGIDMQNGNYRFGLTSWQQKFFFRKSVPGITALRLFKVIKKMEPVGKLEISKKAAEDLIL